MPDDPGQKRGVEGRPGGRENTGPGGVEPEKRKHSPSPEAVGVPGATRAHLQVSARVPASPPASMSPSSPGPQAAPYPSRTSWSYWAELRRRRGAA